MLASRRFDISPVAVCKRARIARSTFYLHYRGRNFVEQHELRLKARFLARTPQNCPNREALLTILLRFVRDERGYFEATIPNANFWLLKMIFAELKPVLQSKDGSQESYDMYVAHQIALISCWVQYEKCEIDKLKTYARKMVAVPVMRWKS